MIMRAGNQYIATETVVDWDGEIFVIRLFFNSEVMGRDVLMSTVRKQPDQIEEYAKLLGDMIGEYLANMGVAKVPTGADLIERIHNEFPQQFTQPIGVQ